MEVCRVHVSVVLSVKFVLCPIQVADMASMLRARHRWMVTGTPIGAGVLRDVYGLLRALQHDPFQDLKLWQTCVEGPCQRGICQFTSIHCHSDMQGK